MTYRLKPVGCFERKRSLRLEVILIFGLIRLKFPWTRFIPYLERSRFIRLVLAILLSLSHLLHQLTIQNILGTTDAFPSISCVDLEIPAAIGESHTTPPNFFGISIITLISDQRRYLLKTFPPKRRRFIPCPMEIKFANTTLQRTKCRGAVFGRFKLSATALVR